MSSRGYRHWYLHHRVSTSFSRCSTQQYGGFTLTSWTASQRIPSNVLSLCILANIGKIYTQSWSCFQIGPFNMFPDHSDTYVLAQKLLDQATVRHAGKLSFHGDDKSCAVLFWGHGDKGNLHRSKPASWICINWPICFSSMYSLSGCPNTWYEPSVRRETVPLNLNRGSLDAPLRASVEISDTGNRCETQDITFKLILLEFFLWRRVLYAKETSDHAWSVKSGCQWTIHLWLYLQAMTHVLYSLAPIAMRARTGLD